MSRYDHDSDPDLRRLFERARREEAADAPPFERLWSAARRSAVRRNADRRPSRAAATGWLAAAVAAGAALFLMTGRDVERPAGDPHLDAAAPLSEWRAPTDFLLVLPGSDLLASLPRIGDLSGDARVGDPSLDLDDLTDSDPQP